MNTNSIRTAGWSNPTAEALFENQWQDSPALQRQYENGDQCGGCSFFAKFNADWGLCCNAESPHHLETVFEHFTCLHYVRECWGPHSFMKDKEFHCRCGGETSEYWDELVKVLDQYERRPLARDTNERTE